MSKAMIGRWWEVRRRANLASVAIVAAVAFGSAYAGHVDASRQPPAASPIWLDAAFDWARWPSPAPVPLPDLNDGRSAVDGRWFRAMQQFERDDRAHPPASGGVVVVGSSSVQYWDGLEAQWPQRRIVRRGLGGARLSDCTRFLDRLVLPHKPRLVLVYAGDNDLAQGGSAEAVLADYTELTRRVQAALPGVRVGFVSIKPSPSREALLPEIRRANSLVADYSGSRAWLDYIDVFAPMLGRDGHPRAELFRADGLHLNAQGYALWRDALGGHLD